MKCAYCGDEIPRGCSFGGEKFKSLRFCNEEHYSQYSKIKNKPKPPVNFKPKKDTDRRKFTDYIQDWTNDNANWAWLMKQAKDIQEEYEINWRDMLQVLKYCREYEEIEWNMEYGLYQFFPRYIKPMKEFTDAILNAREIEDIDDEVVYVSKPKVKVRKVEF